MPPLPSPVELMEHFEEGRKAALEEAAKAFETRANREAILCLEVAAYLREQAERISK